MRVYSLLLILVFLLAPGLVDSAIRPSAGLDQHSDDTLLGRWDMTVQGIGGRYPSWLEIRRSGRHALVGSFVGQVGSARPIGKVTFANGTFHFSLPPQWEDGDQDFRIEGRVNKQGLGGELTNAQGQRVHWTARRAPALKRNQSPRWLQPVELINGKGLAGWRPRSESKDRWEARRGMLVNTESGTDLITVATFRDFKLHAEYRYPRGSNSGIYLRGRYEVQIDDDCGAEPECHGSGAIYGFLTPSVNAAGKPGQWQFVDITLIGRTVSITLNGERIIDRQVIPGITGGALDSDEGSPGPILLQGDHGAIEFRRVTITPAAD